MVEWIECKISDIGNVVGGATPSTKKPENYEKGTIAWITPKDLSTFTERYIRRGERNITETGLKSCSTYLLPKNTVLFSSRAPIGYVAIAANEVCTNQGFKSVVPNDNIDPLFLYYLLKYNKKKIERAGSGTTFKEVSGKTMKDIVVYVPKNKKIQERISSLLGTIDDKIEENNRINNNLEQLAALLFEENYSNNNYNFAALETVATIKYGKGLPKANLTSVGFPVFGGNGVIGKYSQFMYDKPQVLVSCRGAASGNILESYPYSYITNNSLVLEWNDYRYYEFYKQFLFANPLHSYKTGSAQPQITIDNIRNVLIPYPEYEDVRELCSNLNSIYDLHYKNLVENNKLVALRDTLLPKLMSGEINVSNIDL